MSTSTRTKLLPSQEMLHGSWEGRRKVAALKKQLPQENVDGACGGGGGGKREVALTANGPSPEPCFELN